VIESVKGKSWAEAISMALVIFSAERKKEQEAFQNKEEETVPPSQ
jgi:hypothetical protein